MISEKTNKALYTFFQLGRWIFTIPYKVVKGKNGVSIYKCEGRLSSAILAGLKLVNWIRVGFNLYMLLCFIFLDLSIWERVLNIGVSAFHVIIILIVIFALQYRDDLARLVNSTILFNHKMGTRACHLISNKRQVTFTRYFPEYN